MENLNIKSWINRIKFDSSLWISFFVLYFITQGICIFLVADVESFIRDGSYLMDLFIISIYLFSIYIGRKIPEYFQDEEVFKRQIFDSDESYENFETLVKHSFKSKLELILSPIFALLLGFYVFWNNFSTNFEYLYWGPEAIYVIPEVRIPFIIASISWTIEFFLLILVSISAIFVIIITFKIINKLGTDFSEKSKKQTRKNVYIPLRKTYEVMRGAAFENIGKIIIYLAISTLLLATFLSILGLITIFVFKIFLEGYFYLITGLIINILIAFLLYKNTIHIHNEIVKYKSDHKTLLLKQIQNILEKPPNERNYDEIDKIHNFLNEVDKIYDWPYNPKSLKKLAITFLSSILPLMLSFLGLG